MADRNMLQKLCRLHSRLDGNTVEHDITNYRRVAQRVESTAGTLRPLSDTRLREIWAELGRGYTTVDPVDLTVEAYALVHEAIRRVLGLEAFTVQLVGALILHEGRVAEMRTGEGKTLTAVFAACLNALGGRGVHILTFNDYLARRDASWMGPVYRFLGVGVGFVTEGMTPAHRRAAYNADVTYLTAKEAGFDYLRDGLCYDPHDRMQRTFDYAIIDEADSILVDEARVPLIIAGDALEFGGGDDVASLYKMAEVAAELVQERDFALDAYGRNIYLTERGIERVESAMGRGELYAPGNEGLVARVSHALHAEYLLSRDRDYIVRKGKVALVDEFTGRVAERRRWPEGLQAAIEAKEGLPIQSAGMILNSLPLQHFLQLYKKRSGMTATAAPLGRLSTLTNKARVVSLCRELMLHHTDRLWSHFLSAMAETREGIHLRTYGKQDPLFEYQKLAIELFEALPADIEVAVCEALEKLAAQGDAADLAGARGRNPSATWTYTISENPFEDKIRELLGAGGMGLNAWAGLLWPLTALPAMLTRYQRKKEATDREAAFSEKSLMQ